jgi:Glycosyl hydrolases family 18
MPEVDSGETDRKSEAERTVEAERPQADDRAREVRNWFQPVRPANSAEASPAEASPAEASPAEASPAEASPAEASKPSASRVSGGQPATVRKVRGSASAEQTQTQTEPDTVIFPKLRVSRPLAKNGTATSGTGPPTAGRSPAEAKTVPSALAPAEKPPASAPAASAPAEAKGTPPPGGGGSDASVPAQKTRGFYSGSKSPSWPDVPNESEPETVILPKLRVSRPPAKNGAAAAKAAPSASARAVPARSPTASAPAGAERTRRPAADPAQEERDKLRLRPGARRSTYTRPDLPTGSETMLLPALEGIQAAAQLAPAKSKPAKKSIAPPKRRLKRAIARHRPLIVALTVIVAIAAAATVLSVRIDATPKPSGAPPLDIPSPSKTQLAQVATSSTWPTTPPDSAPVTCKPTSLKGTAGASVISYLDDNSSQHDLVAKQAKGLKLLNFSWTSLASPTDLVQSDPSDPSLKTELTAADQSGPCGLRFTTLSDNDPGMSHSADVRMMTEILTSSSVRQAHVLAVAQWIASQPLATGLTIDYENGLPQNLSDLKTAEQVAGWSGLSLDEVVNRLSNGYTELVGEIAAAMHRQHRLVRLMAPVRYSDDVDVATTDVGPYLFNYGALAQYVDQIVLKAYDFNFATGNPGPIAPFADVAKVLTYVHSYDVPWTKLAVAEPLYAYNWTVNKKGDIAVNAKGQPISATTLNATQVDASKKQWHKEKTENGETEYTYTQAGQKHIVWDASSALKTEMAWLKRSYPQIGIEASTIGNADPTGSALAVATLGT